MMLDKSDRSGFSERKPHVVLLNVGRVIEAKGGTEKVFCDMANALCERGYDVSAVFCDPKEGVPGFCFKKEVRLLNAYKPPKYPFLYKNPWRNLFCWRLDKRERKLLRNTLVLRWWAECIKEVWMKLPKADVLVAYQPETAWIAREYLNLNVPLLLMLHGNPLHLFGPETFDLFEEAVASSDVIQVLMPEYIEEVLDRMPDANVIHIPNVAPYYNSKGDLRNKVIITAARVDDDKRPALLVESFALIKDRFPDWKCVWYGERLKPSLDKRLEGLVEQYGLQDRVLFKGKTENVEEKLQEASIFAFPSAYEGFSLALAEAFAMGLPAVGCTDCPSVNSLIRDGENGALADPTPESYANALAKLMEDQGLREKCGAQARMDMKQYSADAVWEAWDRLLRSQILS